MANLAIRLLEKLRAGDELLELAHDETVHDDHRIHAVGALVRLERGEEVMLLLTEMGGDSNRDGFVRFGAAVFLGECGRIEEAVGILVEIVQDDGQMAALRERACRTLTKLGRADEIAELARDERLNRWQRAHAASGLTEIGRAEEGLAILLDLACDQGSESQLRLAIFDAMADSNDAEVRRALEKRVDSLAGQIQEAALAAIERLRNSGESK